MRTSNGVELQVRPPLGVLVSQRPPHGQNGRRRLVNDDEIAIGGSWLIAVHATRIAANGNARKPNGYRFFA